MKVILKADVKAQGKKGDIINVSDGYAANYLFRNGLAEPASAGAVKDAEAQKAALARQKAIELAEYKAMAEKLKGAEVALKVKCGEKGKIFGSLTNQPIADALVNMGYPVEKRQIVLESPIKSTGAYDVEIKLYPNVAAKIKLVVTSE